MRKQNPISVRRRTLFEKWIRVLRICISSKEKMNIMERTNAIKLSADLAMASSRKGRTNWSRALIFHANRNFQEKSFSHDLLSKSLKKVLRRSMARNLRATRTILQKRNGSVSRERKSCSNFVAKRLIQKKTEILRKLVPGGESIEEKDLIEETLDYISSLRAQIDLMRFLAIANQIQEDVVDEENI